MKTGITSLLMSLLLLFALNIQAQKVNVDGILKANLRDTGPIIANDVVKGYYQFYQLEKVDRKNTAYLLKIYDANLDEVGSQRIVGSKYLSLQEGNFNGDAIILRFYDYKNQKHVYHRYTTEAELIGTDEIEATKTEQMVLAQLSKEGDVRNEQVFAIENVGFVAYRQITAKQYTMNFMPSEKGGKKWEVTSIKGKVAETATYLASDENILLSSIYTRPKVASKDMVISLLGTNPKTGKELFRTKVEDNNYTVMVMNAHFKSEQEEVLLFGPYYHKDDKTLKAESLGIAIYTLDMKGEIKATKYLTWGKDVRKFMPVNAQGKMDGAGYIFFHKFISTEDGKIFAIGEQYRKAVDGVGVAMNILAAASVMSGGGGRFGGMTKLAIEDLVVFELSSDLSLENVEIIDKTKSNVSFASGGAYASPQILALMAKTYGGFDYMFTQTKPNSNKFFVGYFDFERVPKQKNKWVFGASVYDNGEYAASKMTFDNGATAMRVMPGKPGYVMVVSYYKKERKIDMELKKITY